MVELVIASCVLDVITKIATILQQYHERRYCALNAFQKFEHLHAKLEDKKDAWDVALRVYSLSNNDCLRRPLESAYCLLDEQNHKMIEL
jgi:hypothetical protein